MLVATTGFCKSKASKCGLPNNGSIPKRHYNRINHDCSVSDLNPQPRKPYIPEELMLKSEDIRVLPCGHERLGCHESTLVIREFKVLV